MHWRRKAYALLITIVVLSTPHLHLDPSDITVRVRAHSALSIHAFRECQIYEIVSIVFSTPESKCVLTMQSKSAARDKGLEYDEHKSIVAKV